MHSARSAHGRDATGLLAQGLLAALEGVHGGQGLASVLNAVARLLRVGMPGTGLLALIEGPDGAFSPIAGAQLPAAFLAAMQDVRLPRAAASHSRLKPQATVAVTGEDPRWDALASAARAHGLSPCGMGGSHGALWVLYRDGPVALSEVETQMLELASPVLDTLLQRQRQDADRAMLAGGFERSPWPALVLGADWRVEQANAAFCAWWQCEPLQARGRGLADVLSPEGGALLLQGMATAAATDGNWQGELSLRHPARGAVQVSAALAGIDHGREGRRYWLHLRDHSDDHAVRQELERLAFRDPVTRLPNRARLNDRLGMALVEARATHRQGALLFIDLDQFKCINDLHGHSHGDAVLRACAERMQASLGAEALLCRVGGDEFVAVLELQVHDRQQARELAEARANQLLGGLRAPCLVRGASHQLGASIGVTLFPKGLESTDELMREADIALYRAKDAGRNRVQVFDADMHRAVSERYRLEQDLRAALARGELQVYLQPQVDAEGTMCGAEALLRWAHPQRGMVPPAEFIPLAEASTLILDIDRYVIGEACRLVAATEAAGRPLRVAVNLSARQFTDGDLVATVTDALRTSGCDPLHLALELTETHLLGGGEAAAATVAALARMGVHFAIDDFGTGYSNLRYLHQLQVQEIKIDKSFVQDMCSSPVAAGLVEVIVKLARHLGKQTVAEGVETAAQARSLLALGCDRLQGYHFGMPVPAATCIDHWLQRAPAAGLPLPPSS